MNIDVREYLRINPISVHELTLSGDGKDCFLVFPGETGDETGYSVKTQKALFFQLNDAIFKNLIVGDENGVTFKLWEWAISDNSFDSPDFSWWMDNVHLTDDQFENYARKTTFEADKRQFENKLQNLSQKIERCIFKLLSSGRLNYAGAVEIQSGLLPRSGWIVPQYKDDETSEQSIGEIVCYDRSEFTQGDVVCGNTNDIVCIDWIPANPIYSDFECGEGHIWCCDAGDETANGVNDVEIPSPISHLHKPSRAETLTSAFSTTKGGGKLVGNFTVGNSSMVSSDKNYGLVNETLFDVAQYPNAISNLQLTYPLWGQNVINWRTPCKTHNNVPPTTNVYIRHCLEAKNQRGFNSYLQSRDSISAAEMEYYSSIVPELEDDFKPENLTLHDCLLRMTLDGCMDQDEVRLMRQTVQMFLDIYADDAAHRLSKTIYEEDGKTVRKIVSMAEILKPKLDDELVLKGLFFKWYAEQMERLDHISQRIQLYHELCISVKPVVYTGQVIISTTADTEKKVIEKYGGTKWRRITNFLNGVPDDSPKIGQKYGEEYVCLRESNVPIHTHQVKLNDNSTTSGSEWTQKDSGGSQTKILNEVNSNGQTRIGNNTISYQISPLEYDPEKTNITVPHDNMPPYVEVYIWECVSTSPHEKYLSGEPKNEEL